MNEKPTSDAIAGGSYRAPSLEHARVTDAMRPGVFSCAAETPIRTVAQMMAQHHIHSVVITEIGAEEGSGRAWGIISDVDVLRAVEAGVIDESAGSIAATEFLTIGPEQPLADAVRSMADHEVTHLVVCDQGPGQPLGVISTLDVAGVIAWGEA